VQNGSSGASAVTGQRPDEPPAAWAGTLAPSSLTGSAGGSSTFGPAAGFTRSVMMKLPGSRFAFRHPRAFGTILIFDGLWMLFLGAVLCSYGFYWGAALWLVMAFVLWYAYQLLVAGLPERVRELERSRALAVDDSAARLRRIERDLHDGAQAQMVAVAMKLGLAREKLGTAIAGPPVAGTARAELERVLELIDAAHNGAKEAITELRDLARGIHPPVLDHGLGTALATLAARSDIPVDLAVELPERSSAAIETIAYFCAAELLTNVVKHSGAQQATLEAALAPGLLRVRVSDDGSGGARALERGGLAGLAERVRTVDGRLQISSPPEGPTVVTVELPSLA
jgi:signal transduction histidine kinase